MKKTPAHVHFIKKRRLTKRNGLQTMAVSGQKWLPLDRNGGRWYLIGKLIQMDSSLFGGNTSIIFFKENRIIVPIQWMNRLNLILREFVLLYFQLISKEPICICPPITFQRLPFSDNGGRWTEMGHGSNGFFPYLLNRLVICTVSSKYQTKNSPILVLQ